MHVYYLIRSVELRTERQGRLLKAAGNVDAPLATEVYVAAQNEMSLLYRALEKRYPGDAVEASLRRVAPEYLAQVPGMPMALGRGALLPGRENSLEEQLLAMRDAHPGRRHFRILLINGFGANLGDNLIGIAAFRHVLTLARRILPSVSFDVLLGWHDSDSLASLFRDVDGIESRFGQGLSLAELGRYQGQFDTTNLIHLPRYGTLPMVDWYLWFMGLDPARIPAECKRNALALEESASAAFIARLALPPGLKIVVNPRASVPLRGMPEATLRRLLDHLLQAWPELTILLIQPLDFEHPRVIQLSGAIATVHQLAALVSVADGLVGVDTFTTHLADALGTPSVTLFSSVAPDCYPYYPLENSLLLPGAEQLPAWGRGKVEPEIWSGMRERYEAAWAALELAAIGPALCRGMETRRALGLAAVPRPPSSVRVMLPVDDATGEVMPSRQRDDPLASALHRAVLGLAAQVLVAGDTVVCLAPGSGAAAIPLGRQVGVQGRLVLVEPRRHLHQLLCANLARADIWHAETHLALPEGPVGRRMIGGFQGMDESFPLSMSNSLEVEPVLCWPLDALALDACALLVVSSPLAEPAVLQGARETLRRLRPVVLFGVLASSAVPSVAVALAGLPYRLRFSAFSSSGAGHPAAGYGILVAGPNPLA